MMGESNEREQFEGGDVDHSVARPQPPAPPAHTAARQVRDPPTQPSAPFAEVRQVLAPRHEVVMRLTQDAIVFEDWQRCACRDPRRWLGGRRAHRSHTSPTLVERWHFDDTGPLSLSERTADEVVDYDNRPRARLIVRLATVGFWLILLLGMIDADESMGTVGVWSLGFALGLAIVAGIINTSVGSTSARIKSVPFENSEVRRLRVRYDTDAAKATGDAFIGAARERSQHHEAAFRSRSVNVSFPRPEP